MTDWEQRMADKARSRGEDGRSLEAAERQAYIDEHAGALQISRPFRCFPFPPPLAAGLCSYPCPEPMCQHS